MTTGWISMKFYIDILVLQRMTPSDFDNLQILSKAPEEMSK